jgi:hypothetical protein
MISLDIFSPTTSPSFAPSHAKDINEFSCQPYSATETNQATVNYITCSFEACPGTSITASLCDSFASGDTYLRLFNAEGNELVANDDYCGLSSNLYYDFPLTASSDCSTFHLRQGCYSDRACEGEVKIKLESLASTSAQSAFQALSGYIYFLNLAIENNKFFIICDSFIFYYQRSIIA